MIRSRDEEIDRNYDYFQRNLTSFLSDHRDEYVLLRDANIVNFFQLPSAARRFAEANYPDNLFSIQEVTDEPVDLGYMSHAVG